MTEFKEMVRALHAAGIEVILDIVFNHTAEGDETGPTLCFRGWDNSIYYMLDEDDPRVYRNYTGLRQHAELQPPHRAHPHHRLPALLGGGDARGRVPLRPRLGARPGPGRPDHGKPSHPGAHRGGSRPARHEDHRRGVGRGRRLPGGIVSRRAVGGVERQVPRRRARFWRGDDGMVSAPGHADSGKLRPVPAGREKALSQHQLRRLPTTASRSTTW